MGAGRLDQNRVLVTGASGFIGQRTLPALLARGFTPIALGRRAPPDQAGVEHVPLDLTDIRSTIDAVRRIRAGRLLHLAWSVAPGRFWVDPDNLNWIGHTLTLLRAFAETGGQRAVIAGTCAEYDWRGSGRLSETSSSLCPATLYGAAKDATRRAAARYAAQEGMSLCWGRVFFLYGPGEKSGRLIADAAAAVARGQRFDATDGTQRRDFMHVDDVANAFAAMTASDVDGAVNIGSGRAVTVQAMLQALQRAAGHSGLIRFGVRPRPENDPACIEAETTRLRVEVGVTPGISLEEGAAAVIAAARQAAR